MVIALVLSLVTWTRARADNARTPASEDGVDHARVHPTYAAVAVMRGPDEYLRSKIVHELHRGFAPQKIALTLAEARAELGCGPREDCRARLSAWLTRRHPVDFIVHPRARGACGPHQRCTRWLVVYDVRCARVLGEIAYREATPGDLVGPQTTALAVARVLQEHVNSPPERAARSPEASGAPDDAHFSVCLSAGPPPDYSEYHPPGYSRCSLDAANDDAPAALLPAVVLVGAGLRRRRRAALTRLADSGALPQDVLARLRARERGAGDV